MKFGPLRYTSSEGVYKEDPAVQDMQVKLERALVTTVGRYVRKLMAGAEWHFHQHGSMQHAMSLGVEFHVLTWAEVEEIERKAAKKERERIRAEIEGMLS